MSSVESVKVAVRVRPYNGREKDANSKCIVRVRASAKPPLARIRDHQYTVTPCRRLWRLTHHTPHTSHLQPSGLARQQYGPDVSHLTAHASPLPHR